MVQMLAYFFGCRRRFKYFQCKLYEQVRASDGFEAAVKLGWSEAASDPKEVGPRHIYGTILLRNIMITAIGLAGYPYETKKKQL